MRRITLVVAAIFFLVSEAFAAVNVIPKPTRVVEGEGSYTLPSALTISYSDKSLAKAAAYLEEILAPATGFEIRLKKGIKGDVRLVLAAPESAEDESYSFVSDAEGVTITSSGYKGIVHGISTFRQLLPYQIESASVLRGVDWKVPVVRIEDRPAYEWRGLMLDPSRHFYSVKETKDFLDLMALYKFSKFHWHLIDSQAWRIEIRKYPLLTDKGAWRDPANEYIDKACEERADNEHDPAMRLPKEHLRQVDGKTLYGGYYSQEDIREIVEYAAVRGIDVVPEIDMPGHNWMATQCYPWLSCGHDGTDPLCLGSDKVIQFAKDVFKEVFDLFPYSYAEIGGDEVSRKKWEGCPLCQERIRRESLGGLEVETIIDKVADFSAAELEGLRHQDRILVHVHRLEPDSPDLARDVVALHIRHAQGDRVSVEGVVDIVLRDRFAVKGYDDIAALQSGVHGRPVLADIAHHEKVLSGPVTELSKL